jgi:type I pantothenate kinase
MGLWRAAADDPASFYAAFRRMGPEQARAFAGQVWRGVNLPNLRAHIAPARALADLVVRKGPAHEILSIGPL